MTKQVTEMKEENTFYKWVKVESEKDLPEELFKKYPVRYTLIPDEYRSLTHYEMMQDFLAAYNIEWLKPVEQPTDQEIEAMAEKEYPKANTEYKGVNAIIDLQQQSFIKGAEAVLQYKPENKK